jgi:protein-tyrosine phosphatase
MSEIVKNKLYLGGIYDVTDNEWLACTGITDVISVITGYDVDSLSDTLKKENIRHHTYDVADVCSQNMSTLFPELFRIIDSSPTVLVHCGMGISRSATVVLAYLMYSKKMYLDDATKYVLPLRPCVFPNDGFIVQLINYEYELFGTKSFLPTKDGIRKFKTLIYNT